MDPLIITQNLKKLFNNGLGTPLLVIIMMAMMVLPLPPFMLDIFFTFNIALSLVVMLACVYCSRPLDFAVFPTVLLVATLLRLALNVASTRVVLLEGHTGTGAAGQVVESFGAVVIGGNYAVGLVVFSILVVINFVVVTKGAGRVSEVSARFTLDALPGKQMAIDADLNSGMITQADARKRRDEVSQEADFYGSMDGSSKFVRGDAIAGILILFINIIGGILIGLLQHNMGLTNAIHNYTLLTIGDGLVAQIPSLLLSTATAIIVTRVSNSSDIGTDVISQVFGHPRSLYITGGVIGSLGLIPGMPHIIFILFGAATCGAAYYQSKAQEVAPPPAELTPAEKAAAAPKESEELSWNDVQAVDIVGLEVGYRLIQLVDKKQGGQLLDRIKGIRKKLSSELGFLFPSVHIRDNLDLAPEHYRIIIAGVTLGEADIHTTKLLAINPGQVFGEVKGVVTKDPAFGLDAVWIDLEMREHAQSYGYTVVDPSTVIATHMSHLLQRHASLLLGYEEVQQLLDRLKETAPKLVSELIPDHLTLGVIVKVLQILLEEGIPIRDIRTIVEALAQMAPRHKDPNTLVAAVRVALGRMIVQTISGTERDLPIITLQPQLEQLLQQSLQTMADGNGSIEPTMAEKLQTSLSGITEKQVSLGQPAVLVVQPLLRQVISRFIRGTLANLHVLSYHEIPDDKNIRIVGTVG